MPDDRKRDLQQALVRRILGNAGHGSVELRRGAFVNGGLPEPVQPLVEKVANCSWAISDEDVAAVGAAGFDDDQLFELVVCAAVGAASRHYEAGRDALASALADRGAS